MLGRIGISAISLVAASAMAATSAFAEDRSAGYVSFDTKADFGDVVADLQDSIVNKGLVIDYVGHVSDMLTRTSEAAGTSNPYANAIYLQFCSSARTHAAVAVDPRNIAMCPYVVFAYEEAVKPGVVNVGFRRPITTSENPSAELAEVEALLEEIVTDSLQ
ncbi:MAG: DUF302 domain-containing protein [Rhizobiaceae bacterium]